MFYPSVFNRNLFVTPTGSDIAIGDEAHPLLTLAEAARRLGSAGGGTINVGSTADVPLVGSSIANTVPITIQPWNADRYYVDAAGAANALTVTGSGLVTLDRGVFTGGTLAGVTFGTTATDGLSQVTATDCTAHGAGTGWNGSGRFAQFTALRCTGLGDANDGFGFHGIPGDPTVVGHATLTDCTADGCGDEAVSPHEYVILNIIGGLFRHSQQSGMAAVGAAVCNISGGAVFELNGLDPANNYGGLYYSETTTGVLNGVVLRDNEGPGIWHNGTGIITYTAYTSTGNAMADIL